MPALDQLRALVALAANDFSVTETARQLGTSQPSVSRRILALEKELGVELLLRRGRHISGFSADGEAIADSAMRLLDRLESLERLAADCRDEEVGELNLVTTHTQARYALTPAVEKFCQRYPKVRLQIHQATPERMAVMVRTGEADLAIATESFEHFDDLIVLPCYRWLRCLIVPPGHRLAGEKRLKSLKDLTDEKLITYSFGLAGEQGILAQCRRAGLQPQIVLTAADAETIKHYVRIGLGLGLIAGMAINAQTDADLTCLDISAFFAQQTTGVALRREGRLRSFAHFFITAFASHLTTEAVQQAQSARSRREIAALFADLQMNVR